MAKMIRKVQLNISIIFTSVIIYGSICTAASPWTHKKGSGYLQIATHIIPPYNSLFLKDGKTFNTSRLMRDNTIQVYGEYGLFSNLTVLGSIPYKLTQTGSPNRRSTLPISTIPGALNAPGDLTIGLKHGLKHEKLVMATEIISELPTSQEKKESGLKTGYGAFSLQGKFSVGIGRNRFYAFGYGGFNYRFNKYSSSVLLGGESGYKLLPFTWITLYADILKSLNNGSQTVHDNFKQTGLYVNNQEYFAYGVKIIQEIKRAYGGFIHVAGSFSGHMVAHSPLMSIGLFWKP